MIDADYSSWGTITPAGVNYLGLIPYLVRAIQEQQASIVDLQARIAVLEGV
jgi:hypothetical protein